MRIGSGSTWDSYAAIMGRAPNRELIWGAFQSTSTVNWAYAYRDDPGWQFSFANGFGLDAVPNGGMPEADMNMWAVYTGESAIPEPSTLLLVAGSLGLLTLLRRRCS